LEPINATKLPGAYAPLAAAAHQGGLTFRIGEMNSISSGGVEGISDTFTSALWSVDIMFNYLVNGMDGVNWHTDPYTIYKLWDFTPKTSKGKTTYTLNSVRPDYYGLLVFAQLAARSSCRYRPSRIPMCQSGPRSTTLRQRMSSSSTRTSRLQAMW
jgi:hypothetical protein